MFLWTKYIVNIEQHKSLREAQKAPKMNIYSTQKTRQLNYYANIDKIKSFVSYLLLNA